MRVDRTWTFSFDDREQELLKAEVSALDLPTDWGRPLMLKLLGAEQVTLPLRAIERLIVELEAARATVCRRSGRIDLRRKYPVTERLYEELSAIADFARRRSA